MRVSSSFSYRIAIPSRIDESENIDASYKDGILKVVFEKSKKNNRKKFRLKQIVKKAIWPFLLFVLSFIYRQQRSNFVQSY